MCHVNHLPLDEPILEEGRDLVSQGLDICASGMVDQPQGGPLVTLIQAVHQLLRLLFAVLGLRVGESTGARQLAGPYPTVALKHPIEEFPAIRRNNHL